MKQTNTYNTIVRGTYLIVVLILLALYGCKQTATDVSAEEAVQEKKESEKAPEHPELGTLLVKQPYCSSYLRGTGPIKAGEKGAVQVVFVPVKGMKINKEYPWKMTVDAPEQLGLEKNKLKKGDLNVVSDKEAFFLLNFSPLKKGDYELVAKTSYSVCDDKSCKLPRAEVKIKIHV